MSQQAQNVYLSRPMRRALRYEEKFAYKYSQAIKCEICTWWKRPLSAREANAVASMSTSSQLGVHLAACQADLFLADLLVRFGWSATAKSSVGLSPMYFALISGCEHIVEYLLDQGSDVDEWIPYHKLGRYVTCLQLAVILGHTEQVKTLLRRKANVHARDRKNLSALHYACIAGHQDIVSNLISHGSNFFAVSKNLRTPVYLAMMFQHAKIVRLLLSLGANKNDQDSQGCSVLHLAARYNQPELFEELLLEGADLRAVCRSKNSALHYAVRGARDYRSLLLPHRLLVIPDRIRESRRYAWLRERSAVGQLLRLGAPVNAPDLFGRTPLHLAAEVGCPFLVQLLLDAGADVDALDSVGLSPLDVVYQRDHVHCVQPLLVAGADFERPVPVSQEVAGIVVRYLLARKVAGLRVDERMLAGLERKEGFVDFRRQYEREVSWMRSAGLVRLLSMGRYGLAAFSGKEGEVRKRMEEEGGLRANSIYRKMIEWSLARVELYAPVLREATDKFERICGFALPVLPIEKIVGYLDIDSLRNLAQVSEDVSSD